LSKVTWSDTGDRRATAAVLEALRFRPLSSADDGYGELLFCRTLEGLGDGRADEAREEGWLLVPPCRKRDVAGGGGATLVTTFSMRILGLSTTLNLLFFLSNNPMVTCQR
jgi:hypothetical protein